MLGVPTLEQVRTWVNVPATAISDADLDQIRLAELTIQARTCRLPADPEPGPLTVTLDGMAVQVVIVGGAADTDYPVTWGDGEDDTLTTDAAGAGQTEHTYDDPGTYMLVVYDASVHVLANYQGTVPGQGTTAPQATYPEALARACLRRCQRQVAARAVPLGLVGADATEYGPVNVPRWDAEIVRLEASYRQVVVS